MASLLLVVAGPAGVGKSTICDLTAGRFERSVCLRADDFARHISHGFIEQWRPEAAHQNEVIGAAMAVSAMKFVEGGYTVLLDGTFFPAGFDGLAEACAARGLTAHYAVLRADLEICLERAVARGPMSERRLFAELHGRFQDLGAHERHVIDASGPPAEVASALLRALEAGELRSQLVA